MVELTADTGVVEQDVRERQQQQQQQQQQDERCQAL